MRKTLCAIILALTPFAATPETTSVLRPQVRPTAPVRLAQLLPDVDGQRIAALAAVPVGDATDPLTPTDQRDLTTRIPVFAATVRPPARSGEIPRTRWQHMGGHALWTRSTLSALKAHGKPLVDMIPADIASWCPAYPLAAQAQRRAFWVGFLSALAKHESTYKPWAVGGGGRWYGLLQILPGTARGYKCNVGTGEALKNGAANLSCAVRIMARTVPRDGVIYGPGGRGVAADWGPMRSAAKRADMARWLKRQTYCKPLSTTRPRARP